MGGKKCWLLIFRETEQCGSFVHHMYLFRSAPSPHPRPDGRDGACVIIYCGCVRTFGRSVSRSVDHYGWKGIYGVWYACMPLPFRPHPRMFNTYLLLGGVVHEVEAADHRLERLVGGHYPVDWVCIWLNGTPLNIAHIMSRSFNPPPDSPSHIHTGAGTRSPAGPPPDRPGPGRAPRAHTALAPPPRPGRGRRRRRHRRPLGPWSMYSVAAWEESGLRGMGECLLRRLAYS